MLPFCSYHISVICSTGWISEQNQILTSCQIVLCNWFRKDKDGNGCGGFGGKRVLKWIVERVSGDGKAVETPIGNMPTLMPLTLVDVSVEDMKS